MYFNQFSNLFKLSYMKLYIIRWMKPVALAMAAVSIVSSCNKESAGCRTYCYNPSTGFYYFRNDKGKWGTYSYLGQCNCTGQWVQ